MTEYQIHHWYRTSGEYKQCNLVVKPFARVGKQQLLIPSLHALGLHRSFLRGRMNVKMKWRIHCNSKRKHNLPFRFIQFITIYIISKQFIIFYFLPTNISLQLQKTPYTKYKDWCISVVTIPTSDGHTFQLCPDTFSLQKKIENPAQVQCWGTHPFTLSAYYSVGMKTLLALLQKSDQLCAMLVHKTQPSAMLSC